MFVKVKRQLVYSMQKTLSLQSLNLSGYYGLERNAYTAIGARGGYIDG